MKKILVILLAVAMVFALVACTPAAEAPAAEEPVVEEPVEEPVTLDYPKNTITIVNPYSAGGNTDIVARLVAEELTTDLGVSVIVDNRTGGSGAVGMLSCATSEADGYTLAICASGSATITPNTSDVGYTVDSFVRVAQLIEQPNLLCVRSGIGVNTWEEYLAYIAENPSSTYATSGATSLANLQISTVFSEAAAAATHVPYDGGAAAVAAVLGGHADAVVTVPGEVAAYIESGEMVPILCTTAERATAYPDVPTATECGYTLAGGVWTGIVAPAGTDPAIVEFLSAAIENVLNKESVQESISNIGSTVSYLNTADFDAKYVAEYSSMKTTLEALGLIG